MKNKILALLFFFAAVSSFADINWFTYYSEAKTAALQENKNIYVLITAPSWCGWCNKLNESVLQDEDFQNYISENYIALYLEDEIDGVENIQLEYFDFGGYPTEIIITPTDWLQTSGLYSEAGLDPQKTIEILKNHAGSNIYHSEMPYKISNDDIWFKSNDDGTWSSNDEQLYYVMSSNSYYMYLVDKDYNWVIAVPLFRGNEVYSIEASAYLEGGYDWYMAEGFSVDFE